MEIIFIISIHFYLNFAEFFLVEFICEKLKNLLKLIVIKIS